MSVLCWSRAPARAAGVTAAPYRSAEFEAADGLPALRPGSGACASAGWMRRAERDGATARREQGGRHAATCSGWISRASPIRPVASTPAWSAARRRRGRPRVHDLLSCSTASASSGAPRKRPGEADLSPHRDPARRRDAQPCVGCPTGFTRPEVNSSDTAGSSAAEGFPWSRPVTCVPGTPRGAPSAARRPARLPGVRPVRCPGAASRRTSRRPAPYRARGPARPPPTPHAARRRPGPARPSRRR